MARAFGFGLAFVGVVLISLAVVYLTMRLATTVRQKRSSARIRKADLSTPWKHYSRYNPDKGVHEVGVERVNDGLVLNRIGIFEFPPDIDDQTLLDGEGEAIARAARYNENRTGM